KPRGVVLLGDEQRKEHRIETALFCPHQIELPVVHPLPHIAAVVELPIDDVDVSVEDEGVLVESPGTIGDLRQSGEDRREPNPAKRKSKGSVSISYFAMGPHPHRLPALARLRAPPHRQAFSRYEHAETLEAHGTAQTGAASPAYSAPA